MGYLLANVAFDTGISAQMADQIIKAAEQLTYRQLCILKLTAEKNSFGLRTQNYREHDSFPRELIQVLYECLDLYIRGFINFGEGGGVAFGFTDIEPSKMTVQGFGVELFNLMKLSSIPNEDLIPIAEQMK